MVQLGMKQAGRYIFWIVFCAWFVKGLASKSPDPTGLGPYGFGAAMGIGFAAATDKRWTVGIGVRVIVGAVWVVVMTVFYLWVFPRFSDESLFHAMTWGVVSSLTAPVIWIIEYTERVDRDDKKVLKAF